MTEQNGDATAPTTVKEFTYTGSGQIKQVNSTTGSSSTLEEFFYDGAGNRTKKVTTPSSGSPSTVSYAYNQANQLCWKLSAASTAGCTAPPTGATTWSSPASVDRIWLGGGGRCLRIEQGLGRLRCRPRSGRRRKRPGFVVGGA